MNIVGIAGRTRSGKDTLAELFIRHGYYGVSLGDIVRDESRVRHASEPDPISVKNMTETANYLRSEKGADFALKEAMKRFKEKNNGQYKGLVVFSVRAPVEADYIIKNRGQLIWVEALDSVRYSRSIEHVRSGEKITSLKDMKAQEELQERPQPGLSPAIQMNAGYVKAHATLILKNNGSDVETFMSYAKVMLHAKNII